MQVLNSSPLEMQMLGASWSSLHGRAAAAAGQSGLMALYDSLFQMMDMQCSQFLVTGRDFNNDEFKSNLRSTVDTLLQMNVVPVINENDSISSAVCPPDYSPDIPDVTPDNIKLPLAGVALIPGVPPCYWASSRSIFGLIDTVNVIVMIVSFTPLSGQTNLVAEALADPL